MNAVEEKKDYFWLYIGALALVLITVILMVKNSESDKFTRIQQLEDEEKSLMNIRIISG